MNDGPPDDFAARLAAAKQRQAGRRGTGASAADTSGMGAGLRLAIDLVSGILVGTGMGYLLDRWLGTRPWLMVLFVLFGFAAGIFNVMRTAKQLDRAQAEAAQAKKDQTAAEAAEKSAADKAGTKE